MPDFFSLGLLGHPLNHSYSPAIHHAALSATHLEGDYHLYDIPPARAAFELPLLLGRLRAGTLQGLNVTIPYKQSILAGLGGLTDTARQIGAANTIWCDSGKLMGDNTDAPGFWRDLQADPIFLADRPESALVLGAGGAARAVCYSLASHGWQVLVAARQPAQANALARQLSTVQVQPVPYPTATELPELPAIGLLVNATPVGMHPQSTNSPWPDNHPLPAAAVLDLVYNPRATRLLQQARHQGLPARNGLGMLLEQATLSFERWTGQTLPRATLNDALQLD